ncbi:MAG: hypothetical protein P8M04_08745 [Akkermansiaceae bacterium]|nr:hypothetical protein [Akkermansiaceae bacterium]
MALSFAPLKSAEKAPELALWQELQGNWNYEIQPAGLKGSVRWGIGGKGSSLWGVFDEPNEVKSVSLAGWRKDSKTLKINGYGSAGNYWDLELTEVSADKITGTCFGILPTSQKYSGKYTGKFETKDRFRFTIDAVLENGEKQKITGLFTRAEIEQKALKCPWKWMLGHWKIERSDGTKADVVWTKPDPNADYLVGNWTSETGEKMTELVGWRPHNQTLVANAHGANGEGFSVRFNKVSADKLSGRFRNQKAGESERMGTIEIRRVNEGLAEAKLESTDGTVITEKIRKVKK